MSRKKSTSHAERRVRRKPSSVHQVLVVLSGTDPLVWRRIEVPEDYSFWDLHVAIQDAMGWLDYHLHEFHVVNPLSGALQRIGIPDDEVPEDRTCTAGWKVSVTDYFVFDAPPALYVYDFGDDWQHVLMYEDTSPVDPSASYPRCIAGARRCPPEDCGGVHGYAQLLEALADADHPEHEEIIEWVGGMFDPDEFDPRAVIFDDPRVRFENAFGESR